MTRQGRGASLAGKPRAGGRGDPARVDRRRLPLLQRELRAAVRAHLRRADPAAERGEPGSRQRGPHWRRAGRRDRQDRRGAARRRRERHRRREARQGPRAAADRFHVHRAAALRTRAQVHRAHAGHQQGGLCGGHHGAARAGHAGPGRDRRGLQHVRRRRATRLAAVAGRLRQRPGGARALPQRGDRRAAPAPARPRAGGQEPVGSATPSSLASSRASPAPRPRWRRWPRSRPSCS